ncbi:MAG: DNA repair protein RecN [Deltaproteobacteria bacterium]|nr:DNA repair protein RecN [Deltaproteobacteria bacterium]
MLVHVSVRDIALIDAVDVELGPGLTVLSGETGAGKSILVEALLLLFGARASSEVVRTGAVEGSVQALVQLEGADARQADRLLAASGLPTLEDGALVLRRVVSREGRSKQLVNGALATVAQLRAVAEPLIDFTGQHAQQALLRPAAQLALLDGFAGHDALVERMGASWDKAAALAAELEDLRRRLADKEQRLDLVRFLLDELAQVRPQLGEDERLDAERRRLANAERLRASRAEAEALLLEGGDGQADALSQLQRALAALQRAAQDDDALVPVVRTLAEACALVDDAGRALRSAAEVAADPERLAQVEDRLDALKRLMKKHGGDLAHVLAAGDALEAEAVTLDSAAERSEELERRLAAAIDDATATADQLTARRKAAGRKLGDAVKVELPALGMQAGRVEVKVEPLAAVADAPVARRDGHGLSSRGSDVVTVHFTANAGEALEPLAKVASGGELSRVLLALKRALLLADPVPVSIFDEVDAGVGGAVGDAIGERLHAIAAGRQVLCITHLPQIAARADRHLVVEKAVDAGRTVSRVRALESTAARTEELARMLGGREITTATRKHAAELLARGAGGAPPAKKPARAKKSA